VVGYLQPARRGSNRNHLHIRFPEIRIVRKGVAVVAKVRSASEVAVITSAGYQTNDPIPRIRCRTSAGRSPLNANGGRPTAFGDECLPECREVMSFPVCQCSACVLHRSPLCQGYGPLLYARGRAGSYAAATNNVRFSPRTIRCRRSSCGIQHHGFGVVGNGLLDLQYEMRAAIALRGDDGAVDADSSVRFFPFSSYFTSQVTVAGGGLLR
jgi:hypothetical protein